MLLGRFFLIFAGIASAQTGYTINQVPVVGLLDGDAYGGINASGVVAGSLQTAGSVDRHAFVFDPSSGVTDLGTLGGLSSRANRINRDGVIVGRSETKSGFTHAFRYSRATGMQDLHAIVTLGGDNSAALGINDIGQAVGWAETPSGDAHAFFYDPVAGVRDLQTMPPLSSAVTSTAYDIDWAGRIVGFYTTESGDSHGFLLSIKDGSFRDIGTFGGMDSIAFRLMNGQAVGVADVDATSWHAFSFQTRTQVQQDLGAFGGLTSTAFDLNAMGQIVGGATFSNGEARAFLYDELRGMQNLNALLSNPEWILFEAQSINERGQIAGIGFLNGSFRLFILTPTAPFADLIPPELSLPADQSVPTANAQGAVSLYQASAYDQIDGPVSVACVPASGSTFATGITTVNCSAVDSSNNGASGSFSVIVSPSAQPPDPLPVGGFHGIGDLPGGPVISSVWDATRLGGSIYAVGSSAANSQTICVAPNNPAGCVFQFNSDTSVLWAWNGTTGGLTALPSLVTTGSPPVNVTSAWAITRDASFIASQARSSVTNPGQTQPVRVTRSDLSNLNLSTTPFPALPPSGGAQAISEDGSVLYGFAGSPAAFRVYRYHVGSSSSVAIPLLLNSHGGNVPTIRGTSVDGGVMVGVSFPMPFTFTNGRAFRYVHSEPVGAVTAIPLLTGGTWNNAAAVTPDGRTALVIGNSVSYPNGEAYLYRCGNRFSHAARLAEYPLDAVVRRRDGRWRCRGFDFRRGHGQLWETRIHS